jgi:tRNA pseudouridine38-40 synthase
VKGRGAGHAGRGGVRCLRLEIEYEGTRYAGWQRQPSARTVQGELLKAAEALFGSRVEIGGSGRTDAGVHALAQVAHLRTSGASQLSTRDVEVGLNRSLPHDINVLSVRPAPPTFHARHDALARYYLYQISTRRTAFAKPFVWWVRDRLDVERMRQAAALFAGRRDFRSFSEPAAAETSTIVRVETAEVDTSGDLILFRIGASHFLWKMVRRLAGALVEVGRGHLSANDVRALLEGDSREPAAWTAPPSGLFLERVLYRGDAPPVKRGPAFAVTR